MIVIKVTVRNNVKLQELCHYTVVLLNKILHSPTASCKYDSVVCGLLHKRVILFVATGSYQR